jgi:hypothetical protein
MVVIMFRLFLLSSQQALAVAWIMSQINKKEEMIGVEFVCA